MHETRYLPAVVQLKDGRVLAAGGFSGPSASAGAEIYEPVLDAWTRTSPMSQARHNPGTILLEDGRVLVAGGRSAPSGNSLDSAEIFDPKEGRWSTTGRLAKARDGCVLLPLPEGRVLAVGGYFATGGLGRHLSSAEIYDPKTGAWTLASPMRTARHNFAALHLSSGKIFIAGGDSPPGIPGAGVEVYDPSTGRWSWAAPMATTRMSFGASELKDGRVLVFGGNTENGLTGSSEVYDPASDRWSPAPSMHGVKHVAAAVSAGAMSVALGGENSRGVLGWIEAYSPVTSSWATWRLKVPRKNFRAVLLNGRRILAVGGDDPGTSEVADLDAPNEELSLPVTASPRTAFLTAPAPAPAAPAFTGPVRAQRPNDYAVIVGVGRYQRLPAADYADQDARDMSAALAALGVPEENVILLSGQKASLAEITKYVEEWLPRRVEKDSRVYFFYSGHGAPDIKEGTPYLMPWDADATFVKSTGFSLGRLYLALGSLPAREIVAFIDACFSGSGGRSVLAPGLRPLVVVAAHPLIPSKITVLTASEKDEAAGSLPERGHGLFTYHVLQGLSGAADADRDGHATVAELHAYARKRVIVDARRQNREQTPTLTTRTPGLHLY